MNIQIIETNDGSSTIYLPDLDETYHSKFGAVNEAQHVFIDNGLAKLKKLEIVASASSATKILEIGFGTGLNALLTLLYSERNNLNINYITVEKHPLSKEIISSLNYSKTVTGAEKYFDKIHEVEWERSHQLSEYFMLKKVAADILDDNLSFPQDIDLIYFDAFAPSKQAELWSEGLFKRLYNCLNEEGRLITYSAAGIVKQALRNAEFTVKRLQGPPGKHHMLFCSK
jgi:tRNA U34 5-methylaminomethyl-2-thiouridine-forming methyltransferase MnmC